MMDASHHNPKRKHDESQQPLVIFASSSHGERL
jgi:hypothetical protein